MNYQAKHRYADTGPRKIRQFADLIRGRNVDEALQLLRFYHNRGAKLLELVVRSALGNADDRECPDLDALYVSEARVDGAPMFKRIQPRARGWMRLNIGAPSTRASETYSASRSGHSRSSALPRALLTTASRSLAPRLW